MQPVLPPMPPSRKKFPSINSRLGVTTTTAVADGGFCLKMPLDSVSRDPLGYTNTPRAEVARPRSGVILSTPEHECIFLLGIIRSAKNDEGC